MLHRRRLPPACDLRFDVRDTAQGADVFLDPAAVGSFLAEMGVQRIEPRKSLRIVGERCPQIVVGKGRSSAPELIVVHAESYARTGANSPKVDGARHKRFDPARAALLDDPSRFDYLPPERVVELLDLPPNAVACDFGTGTGTYAIALAQRRPDVRVLAFDTQPAMLERARAKTEAGVLTNLTFLAEDEIVAWRTGIDRVLAINVLHELSDAALASVVSLLRGDGRALFIDWNGAIAREIGPPNDRVYTPGEARDRLTAVGLLCESEADFRYQYALRARRV